MKAEFDRVMQAIETAHRTSGADLDADEVIAKMIGSIRSMAELLRNPETPLEQRRDVLRRLFPKGPNGERPIRVEFDLTAGRGWRRALRRVTVRHLTVRALKVPFVVAGAVSFEAGQPGAPGWDPVGGLPTAEWELVPADLGVGEAEPVGVASGAWA